MQVSQKDILCFTGPQPGAAHVMLRAKGGKPAVQGQHRKPTLMPWAPNNRRKDCTRSIVSRKARLHHSRPIVAHKSRHFSVLGHWTLQVSAPCWKGFGTNRKYLWSAGQQVLKSCSDMSQASSSAALKLHCSTWTVRCSQEQRANATMRTK